jgi:hypothetical protein
MKLLYSSEITFNPNYVRYRKLGESLKLVIIKKRIINHLGLRHAKESGIRVHGLILN